MTDASKAEDTATVDEVADLRARINKLEHELKKEREKHEHREKHRSKRDDADDEIKKSEKAFEKFNEEMARLTRGFLFAGLEAMKLSARVTKEFVDKTSERSSPERHDT